jgi:hypothetical protein
MPITLKNTGPVLPYIRYSPQANTMTIASEDNKPREIPYLGKSFAIDIENGMPGWLLLGEGLRDWKPFPLGSSPPAPGPGFKRGFAILIYAPKLLGSPEAHEMCSSTFAHLSFCERLYNEAEPNFSKGNVPIVKITEAEPIKAGKGKSRELRFEIIKWTPRPAAIVDALTKLKAANATPNKAAAAGGAVDNDDHDFDDEDVTGPPKEEATTEKSEESMTRKPKGRGTKAQPKQPHLSNLLDDEFPLA